MCNNLQYLDLSNFDTSSVVNMKGMFSQCNNLLSLDLSSFNTKNVVNMLDLFAYCYKLTSINVSSFDTSKVENMKGMFYHCYDLKYLDLSNFNTSSTTNVESMFTENKNLIYLNISSFKFNNSIVKGGIFSYTQSKICIYDDETLTLLSSGFENVFNCSDLCFQENIKIDLQYNICVIECNKTGYKYEYNLLCHEKCPDNTYPIENNNLCLDKKPEGYYLDNNIEYKKCFETCKTCDKAGTLENNNCKECQTDYIDQIGNKIDFPYEVRKDEYKNCYKECPENFTEPENVNAINKYLCKPICPKEKPYEIISKQKCVITCPFEELKIDNCILNYKSENKGEDETKVKNDILRNMETGFTSPDYNTSNIENGEDEIYEFNGMTVTLSTSENQKNNENNNMTAINLGECENLLRKEYSIPDDEHLYIKKIDVVQEGMQIPKVEFDVYAKLSGKNLFKLSLSVCKDVKITISYPAILTDSLEKLNSSSDYYNDVCYIVNTDNGADITLSDRQKEFVEGNKTVCQDGCVFEAYDDLNKKAKCACKPKESSPSILDMKIDKSKLYDNFIDINNIANIQLMKCVDVLFNKTGIIKNIASYCIIFIELFHIIAIIVFYSNQKKKLDDKIEDIIYAINNWNLIKEEEKGKENKTLARKIKNNNNNNLLANMNRNIKGNKNNKLIKQNSRKKIKKKNNPPIKKSIKRNIINNYNYVNTLVINNNDLNSAKRINKTESKQEKIIKIRRIMKYIDEEMNNLKFDLALKNDKRTYWMYYASLLRTKHALIFSFFNNNDYNARIIKMDLFFINFALEFSVNALFFNDKTMHKLYEDEGKFDIIYQLPQILYSYAISYIIGKPLEILAYLKIIYLILKKKDKRNILIKEQRN